MRHAAKVDANQAEIVAALRSAGYSVALTHRNGEGFPDLVVGLETDKGHRYNVLMEVKRDHEKLNDREVDFHSEWRGQIAIVRSIAEAIGICEMVRERV